MISRLLDMVRDQGKWRESVHDSVHDGYLSPLVMVDRIRFSRENWEEDEGESGKISETTGFFFTDVKIFSHILAYRRSRPL